MYQLLSKNQSTNPEINLFQLEPKSFRLPKLDCIVFEEAFVQLELFGFTLCSPFELLKEQIFSSIKAKEIVNHEGEIIEMGGYLVKIKNTKTSKGEIMQFGTFIDQTGDWIDTVHFPNVTNHYPFRGKACYKIRGKVVVEFDYPTLEVIDMTLLNRVSRD